MKTNEYTSEFQAMIRELRAALHPDRCKHADCTSLMQALNKAVLKGDEATIRAMYAAFQAGAYDFEDAEPQAADEGVDEGAIIAAIKAKSAKGAKVGDIRSWVSMQYDITAEKAAELVKQAGIGRGGDQADKAKAIAILIKGKSWGQSNKQIEEELMKQMGWTKSTAATLLSYYSYMQEYARQA
jgi:hypothetical protein